MLGQKLIAKLREKLSQEELTELMDSIKAAMDQKDKQIDSMQAQISEYELKFSDLNSQTQTLVSKFKEWNPEEIRRQKAELIEIQEENRRQEESIRNQTQSIVQKLSRIESIKEEAERIQEENNREEDYLYRLRKKVEKEKNELDQTEKDMYDRIKREGKEKVAEAKRKVRENSLKKIEDLKYFCIDWLREYRRLYLSACIALVILSMALVVFFPQTRMDLLEFVVSFLAMARGLLATANRVSLAIGAGRPAGMIILGAVMGIGTLVIPIAAVIAGTVWFVKKNVVPYMDYKSGSACMVLIPIIALAPLLHKLPIRINTVWIYIMAVAIYFIKRKFEKKQDDDYEDLYLDSWEENFLREYRRKYLYR